MTDPYLDPESGVLANLPGITDADEVTALEDDVTAVRIAQLAGSVIPGVYDSPTSKPSTATSSATCMGGPGPTPHRGDRKGPGPFCRAEHLVSQASHVFGRLRDLPPTGDRTTAATNIADHLGEINALHPFREGNGRAQRSFLRQWIAQWNWAIDWSAVDPDENDAASRHSLVTGDSSLLTTLIGANLQSIVPPQN